MAQIIKIDSEEVFKQVKLSLQIPKIFEDIIIRKVIEAKAEECGIQVETTELQKAADYFRVIKQLSSPQITENWLKRHLLSLDDFEYLLHIQALCEKLVEHLFADRVESYFYENRLNYAGVVMYEVVIEDRDLAMELFYELQEGEIDFQQIAREYVRDLALRRAGGYRGIVRRSELKPEVCAAVFTANPPQLLEPIETNKGYHLIIVEEIIQPKLDEQLQAQIMNDLFSMWLKQQIQDATYQWTEVRAPREILS